MQSVVPRPSDLSDFLRPESEVAITELCESLESTRSLLAERMGQGQPEGTELDSLPQDRRSLAFVRGVFKYRFSPSDIEDAITALKDFQFEVESCQQATELASQQVWMVYDTVKTRTLQRRASVSTISTISAIPQSSIEPKATTSFRQEIINRIKTQGVASTHSETPNLATQTGREARAGTSAEENTSTSNNQTIAISGDERHSKNVIRGFWGLSKPRQTTK